jgi:hypothetical protein
MTRDERFLDKQMTQCFRNMGKILLFFLPDVRRLRWSFSEKVNQRNGNNMTGEGFVRLEYKYPAEETHPEKKYTGSFAHIS